MKLYDNKKEITLADSIGMMHFDQVPGHCFEYMISFDDVERVIRFGKTETKFDGMKYFIHAECCPALSYDTEDEFMYWLCREIDFSNGYYFKKKKFHIWQEVK